MRAETYIKPIPISESISAFLRDSILDGRLKPSQRINEREVAEVLGVSRSPVREALRGMAKEGLIKILPRKGAIVAGLSERELLELFETREMIELYSVDLIKKHAVTHFTEIRESLDYDISATMKEDIADCLNKTIEFHLALVKTARNSMLYQHYQVLSDSLRRYQLFAATFPSRMERSVREHTQVLEALINGDFSAAKRLLKKHLEALRAKMLNELDFGD
jgi:DNA-binding GntR family transcriptional regulator